jgi:cell pole-organizing protein PopZ
MGANVGRNMRSEAEFRQSIESLLEEAETSVQTDEKSSERMAASGMSSEELDKYVRDLDLMISEDALITMRAQFLRFSSLFDTDQSRDVIRSAVAEVTKPMLEEWINKNMPTIARDVITEAISQIAEFRPEK